MTDPTMNEATKVPNLYDFLRGIVAAGPGEHLTEQEVDWCKHYLRQPNTELHFKSYFTGTMKVIEEPLDEAIAAQYLEQGYHVDGQPAEPEISYDLALAGKATDVFTLLAEAMTLNPNFASLVINAARYYQEHVPYCPHCKEHHDGRAGHVSPMEITSWEFKPLVIQLNDVQKKLVRTVLALCTTGTALQTFLGACDKTPLLIKLEEYINSQPAEASLEDFELYLTKEHQKR